jgi:transcriptional regulator GlxA family with amidase domain
MTPGRRGGLLQGFEDYLAALATSPEESLPRLIPQALALIAEVTVSHTESGEQSVLMEMQRLIRSNLAYSGPLPSLFASIPMSYSSLRRLFREEVGMGPGEYRIRCRIAHAQDRLLSPNATVASVSAELGYPSPYAFSAQFKQIVGLPPSHWIRKL